MMKKSLPSTERRSMGNEGSDSQGYSSQPKNEGYGSQPKYEGYGSQSNMKDMVLNQNMKVLVLNPDMDNKDNSDFLMHFYK